MQEECRIYAAFRVSQLTMYSYNEEGSLVPELSDGEPEVSEDGLTYTFKIKDGLKWSDGETLDAEDRQHPLFQHSTAER